MLLYSSSNNKMNLVRNFDECVIDFLICDSATVNINNYL